jgi:hypothetical protein
VTVGRQRQCQQDEADQAREQGNKQSGLLVREAAQYLTITPE